MWDKYDMDDKYDYYYEYDYGYEDCEMCGSPWCDECKMFTCDGCICEDEY